MTLPSVVLELFRDALFFLYMNALSLTEFRTYVFSDIERI
jgi:hypothetical protein